MPHAASKTKLSILLKALWSALKNIPGLLTSHDYKVELCQIWLGIKSKMKLLQREWFMTLYRLWTGGKCSTAILDYFSSFYQDLLNWVFSPSFLVYMSLQKASIFMKEMPAHVWGPALPCRFWVGLFIYLLHTHMSNPCLFQNNLYVYL